jgi:hypothetical protein
MPTRVSWPEPLTVPFTADHGVQAQQLDGDRRIREVDLASLQGRDDAVGKRVDVDLQSDCERRLRIDGRDDLVHPKHVRPQLLIPKRVVSKDGSSVFVLSFRLMPSRGERDG